MWGCAGVCVCECFLFAWVSVFRVWLCGCGCFVCVCEYFMCMCVCRKNNNCLLPVDELPPQLQLEYSDMILLFKNWQLVRSSTSTAAEAAKQGGGDTHERPSY